MYIVYEYVIHILMVNTFLGSPQAQKRCSYTGCADEEMEAQSGGATTPPKNKAASSGLSDGDGNPPKA